MQCFRGRAMKPSWKPIWRQDWAMITSGMSTIPEVIIANHCGMKVLALSGVPCPAAAYSDQEITHEQVMENCQSISDKAMILIGRFIKEL